MAEIITNLHPDGDENTNLYPNIKKENIPNKSINTNKLDDDVLSLIGSLKPSGTDTSTNILAYTSNKGIYVATDNGHWYYWNGSAYADGGVYISAPFDNELDGTSTNAVQNKAIVKELGYYPFEDSYNDVDFTFIRTDQYYGTNGTLVTGQAYYYQAEINVTASEIYLMDCVKYYTKSAYVVLDENNVVIAKTDVISGREIVTDLLVTIPTGGVKLILQASANERASYSLQKYSGKKLKANSVTENAFDEILKSKTATSSLVNLFNLNDEDVIQGSYIDRNGTTYTEATFNVSGFIPIEQNVTYSFPVYPSFFGESNVIYVPYYDGTKTYYSFATGTLNTEKTILTVTFTEVAAKYARVNFPKINSYHVKSIVTNPECFMFAKAPYPSAFVPYGVKSYFSKDVYLSLETKQFLNPLFRKKVVFTGDSICNGRSANDGLNGWAGRIGRKNEMLWVNKGISGATLTANLTDSAGVISNTNFEDADYLIIEGGTNDADLIGNALTAHPAKFGTYNMSDFTSNFDADTYCGAIESLFKRVLNDYPSKKIGVIIAQKMGRLYDGNEDFTKEHNNRRYYFETLINLCIKWGIPYLNLWDGCHLNPQIPAQYTSGQTYMYTDGQHLTSNGYDYISPIIEEWMKTL